ncbi:MAG: adenylate/guanylate cyclase domain-containing protein [Chthoniobacterales bacterium]
MRFLKATIIIGVLSIGAVLLLDAAGWIRTLEVATADLLTRMSPTGSLTLAHRGWAYGLAAALAFAVAWTTIDVTRPVAKTLIAGATIFLLLSGTVVLALYGTFLSPYQAILAIIVSFIAAAFYGGSESGARKKVLRRLFGERLSTKDFHRLVDSDVPLSFAGTDQDATVVVCEVHNHVELTETLEPSDYVALTNLYLKTAADYLVEAGGYLDECNGESLRVVFGAPLAREDHAKLACRAALELSNRIDGLNRDCDSRWHQRLDFRVGINSGPMIAGAYGGRRLGAFSVAGPTVEFARRLCAACANYGCRILMGPETLAEARDGFEARPIDLIKRENHERVELYELLAVKGALSPESVKNRDLFWRGAIYFRVKNWDGALAEFEKARTRGLPDPALDNFILRAERARRGQFTNSPSVQSLAEIS